jgi:hypothetical protein
LHNPSSNSDSDPTIAYLRNYKTRSLREIYEQLQDLDQEEQFSLLSYQPTYFQEAVKEEQWFHAMNEELEQLKETIHGILYIFQ